MDNDQAIGYALLAVNHLLRDEKQEVRLEKLRAVMHDMRYYMDVMAEEEAEKDGWKLLS